MAKFYYRENEKALQVLAKYLRHKRKEKGYTQRDVSKLINPRLSIPVISDFENGKSNNFLLMLSYMKLLLTEQEVQEVYAMLLKNDLYGIDIKE